MVSFESHKLFDLNPKIHLQLPSPHPPQFHLQIPRLERPPPVDVVLPSRPHPRRRLGRGAEPRHRVQRVLTVAVHSGDVSDNVTLSLHLNRLTMLLGMIICCFVMKLAQEYNDKLSKSPF